MSDSESQLRGISRLTLGCADMGSVLSERDSVTFLRAAVDLGFTSFDTAPLYGRGMSETILGEAFQGYRHPPTIITKFGREPPRQNSALISTLRPIARKLPNLRKRVSSRVLPVEDHSSFTIDSARISVSRSLLALKRSRIDVLLFHSPSRSQLIASSAPPYLDSLVQSGRLGAWGVSVDTIDVAEVAFEIGGCSVIEYPFNTEYEVFVSSGIVDEARHRNYTLIARSPLGGGTLPRRSSRVYEAEDTPYSVDALITYASMHSGADTVVTATSKVQRLSNLASVQAQRTGPNRND